jgi:hypothetical protein
MRIDGPSPVPPEGPRFEAPEVKRPRVPATAAVKDRVETQPKPEVSPTSVLVEMQPGNIVVYKFVDEASGRLIQQIPSEQMLKLSKTGETPKE